MRGPYPSQFGYISGVGLGSHLGDDIVDVNPGGIDFTGVFDASPTVQPSAPISSTASGGGFDSTFFTNILKLVPNIISAGQGHSYGSTQYGQQSAPGGSGLSLTGGVPMLGGGSLGISSSTLLLFGIVALAFFVMKK
jgi:hypothetical protein